MTENKRNTSITQNPMIENISYYKTAQDGKLYFCSGKTRIEVVEHFADYGKNLGAIVEDVITHASSAHEHNAPLN